MTRGPKKRLPDRTVDEAMESQGASDIALRYMREARTLFFEIIADGKVTVDEAKRYLATQEAAMEKQVKALRKANDVVRMAEKQSERQKLGWLFAEYEDFDIPAHAIQNAATVDVFPPTLNDAA